MSLSIRSSSLKNRSRKGSALILTLVFVGVISISVGAMLSSVRHLARSADDKLAEEECYQTALSGINLVRAWVMTPDLARIQSGDEEIGESFAALRDGALACSRDIVKNRLTDSYIHMSASDIAHYYDSSELSGFSKQIGDGRVVLHEWIGANKLLALPNADRDGGEPDTNVINGTTDGARSWIDKIRVTTPYVGQDDMRFVSFIIEAEAVTRGAGVEKRRVVTSKVLAIPEMPEAPPLAKSNAAVVAGGGVSTSGQKGNNSSMLIHWGAVWTKGNLTVLDAALAQTVDGYKLSVDDNKYVGIGSTYETSSRQKRPEKWVKWQAGLGSKLITKTNNGTDQDLFPADGLGAAKVPVSDFFAQVKNGAFGESKFSLGGDFTPSDILDRQYYEWDQESEKAVAGNGAFVQNMSIVNTKIDNLYSTLGYSEWKNYAIQQNSYIRPTSAAGSTFVNDTGQILYVTPQKTLTTDPSKGTKLSGIGQLSMKHLVPADGVTTGIADRMLFIDSAEGTEAGTTRLDVKVNSSLDFFWKGMIWHHGSMDVSGGGAMPKVWGQDPDQWRQVVPDSNDSDSGTWIDNCLIDGILRVSGDVNRSGNISVYGSMVVGNGTTGKYTGAGKMEIFYNTRCGEGLFQPDVNGQKPLAQGLVGGPIAELASYQESR